jgi:hypothetical protein
VVLHDIEKTADPVVEAATVLDPEVFSHRDLDRPQGPVQLLGARKIVAEGLLHDHPPAACTPALSQSPDDGGEQLGRDGQVVYRVPRATELGPEGLERGGIVVVAVDTP